MCVCLHTCGAWGWVCWCACKVPAVCAHTHLKHTYACFSHGKTCQLADVWHHAPSKEEVFHCLCYNVCVCVGGKEEDGCYHDLWIGQQFPTGQRRQEWLHRGMLFFFFFRMEGCAGTNERMTRGENSRKTKKWISTISTTSKDKTTGKKETDVKRQDAQRSSVFTLSILSVSASSIVFISDTAGNPWMTHHSLKCCEPGFAGGEGEGWGSTANPA